MRNSGQRTYLIIVMLLGSLLFTGRIAAAEPLGKRIVLKNGMVLLLSEKHELPVVTINMAVRAGSLAEPGDKPGLASITASLLTQGTTSRTANDISRAIDFVGGSLSVSGGDDFATAGIRVLKKDMGAGLDLLADVLMHPLFDQKEIDRKVNETLASIRQSKDEPEVIAGEAFSKAVFGKHPYGRTNDDIAAFLPRITRQDIVDFYKQRYGPNNCIMAVVGDVTEKEVVAALGERFGGWKAAEGRDPVIAPPPTIPSLTADKMDKKITQANIAMGDVGISRGNPDFYAVVVMNYILGGGGFSSRLMDNIRDNRGLAYDVHSTFSAQKDPGAFRIWTQTKSESANEAIAEIFKELNRIRTETVSDKELTDAKAYLTGSFPLRMDTSSKIALMLTNIEFYGLGLEYPREYVRLVNAVSKDDILRVARQYIHPDHMIIVVLGDQEKIKLKY